MTFSLYVYVLCSLLDLVAWLNDSFSTGLMPGPVTSMSRIIVPTKFWFRATFKVVSMRTAQGQRKASMSSECH